VQIMTSGLDEVESILEQIPETHQTALFSATTPREIRRTADRHLKDPITVQSEQKTLTVPTVEQQYLHVRQAAVQEPRRESGTSARQRKTVAGVDRRGRPRDARAGYRTAGRSSDHPASEGARAVGARPPADQSPGPEPTTA
jgi:superfamily II DNA/RNA helicase